MSVLVMLVVNVAIDFSADDLAAKEGLEALVAAHAHFGAECNSSASFEHLHTWFREEYSDDLVKLHLGWEAQPRLDDERRIDGLRSIELIKIAVSPADAAAQGDAASLVWFSKRAVVVQEAIFGLLRTMYITLMLAGLSFFFSSDAERIVIGPIERMINRVSNFAANPLEFRAQEQREKEEREAKLEEAEADRQLQAGLACWRRSPRAWWRNLRRGKQIDLKELRLIGGFVDKVRVGLCVRWPHTLLHYCLDAHPAPWTCTLPSLCVRAVPHVQVIELLQIGMGEAGARIIASNLAFTGVIEPMTSGTMVRPPQMPRTPRTSTTKHARANSASADSPKH